MFCKIKTVLCYLSWLIIGLVYTPISFLFALTRFFDRNDFVFHKFSSFYAASLAYFIPGFNYKIYGEENISIKKKYVFIGNHQSVLDILLGFQTPVPVKWVSKRELFQTPFVGWMLFLGNHIGIKRGDKYSAGIMVKDAESMLEKGISVIIFPEGTRSSGKMLRFKDGAFKIAKETKTDIVPFIIEGVLDLMPKNSWYFKNKKNVTLTFLEPVPYNVFKDMDSNRAANYFRNLMQIRLDKEEKTEKISEEAIMT